MGEEEYNSIRNVVIEKVSRTQKILHENNFYFYEGFQFLLKKHSLDNHLVLIHKTSIEASKEFEDNSLGVVMIDANHSYQSVLSDFESWIPKVKKGGLICGDDYNYLEVRNAVKYFFNLKKKKFSMYSRLRVEKIKKFLYYHYDKQKDGAVFWIVKK
jgi:hypothetical protein